MCTALEVQNTALLSVNSGKAPLHVMLTEVQRHSCPFNLRLTDKPSRSLSLLVCMMKLNFITKVSM